MKRILTASVSLVLLSLFVSAQPAFAQPAAPGDSLLSHLTGNWILHGTIAGRDTTHDIESEWVLNHEYVRIHEVSREKNGAGQPAYEAIVYIAWDQAASEYLCLWLDSTTGGGLSGPIAHGRRSGDQIPFVFKFKEGSTFHTTFIYTASTDSWQWLMDDDEAGKLTPFARVKLTRK
jgi:hypothetical protein